MALVLGCEPSVLIETACPWACAVIRKSAKKNRILKNACFPDKQKEVAWAAAAAD